MKNEYGNGNYICNQENQNEKAHDYPLSTSQVYILDYQFGKYIQIFSFYQIAQWNHQKPIPTTTNLQKRIEMAAVRELLKTD